MNTGPRAASGSLAHFSFLHRDGNTSDLESLQAGELTVAPEDQVEDFLVGYEHQRVEHHRYVFFGRRCVLDRDLMALLELTIDPLYGWRGPLGDGDPGANPRQTELNHVIGTHVPQFDLLVALEIALDLEVGVGPVEERIIEVLG
jgi:hypothetical protein